MLDDKPKGSADGWDKWSSDHTLIIENGYDSYARFSTLEAVWPGIAPSLALLLSGSNTRLQALCDALQTFLEFQGRWDERLALSEKAEARALAATDHTNAGGRAYNAGRIHALGQQADTVLACVDRTAVHGANAKAGVRERALVICLRGIGHQLKKEYPAAITTYSESLNLHRSFSAESRDVVTSLNSLAEVEQVSGDFAAEEGHYHKALHVARVVGDAEGVAVYTGNLASLALDREDWPGC